jgi:hypothetical protein
MDCVQEELSRTHSLEHFYDVHRTSRNYSNVLGFIVDRKFIENELQGVLR